jgi:hypothetical protein
VRSLDYRLGNTFYENGSKVKRGDTVTKEQAHSSLFYLIAAKFEKAINENVKVK